MVVGHWPLVVGQFSICKLTVTVFQPTTKDQGPKTNDQHGPATRTRLDLDLTVLVPGAGALQPQFSAAVAGADRQRGRRLVLYAGNLQPAAATDRPGKFGCAGAGAAGTSPDVYRPSGRSHQRSHKPEAGDDRRRPGADGHCFRHAAGALPIHGVAGLSAAVAGDADGRVFRARAHFGDSQCRRAGRRAGGQHSFVGHVVGEPAGRCIGWRSRGGAVRARCCIRAQRAFISGVGDVHPRDAF